MLLDPGPHQFEPVDADSYAALAGARIGLLLRIETIVDPLLERGASADEVLAEVETAICAAAAAGCAGSKTKDAARRVWPEFAFEATFDGEGDDEDDSNRWLQVWPTGSRRVYDDMVAFTRHPRQPPVATQLVTAFEGRGAFRRFKSVLFRQQITPRSE